MPCDDSLSLGEVRDKHTHGIITIDSQSETGAVEQEFERRFGLHIQIYRLQMDRWVQTVGTDILTLSEQNDIAKDSATFYNPNHQLQDK